MLGGRTEGIQLRWGTELKGSGWRRGRRRCDRAFCVCVCWWKSVGRHLPRVKLSLHWRRPLGLQKVEAPRILGHLAHEGGKIVSLTYRPSLLPSKTPLVFYFCWRLSRPHRKWTRDLSACSAVPQPTELPRALTLFQDFSRNTRRFLLRPLWETSHCTDVLGNIRRPKGEVEVLLCSYFNLGSRWGGWLTPRPGRFSPGSDLVPIVQEAGWATGPVWTGAENLASAGIRSPDRSARIDSLYRLSYRTPPSNVVCKDEFA
jgi:hypothetical protein